jgi:gliding motility associated protien GldN
MKIALKLAGMLLMLFSTGALMAQLPSDIIMTEAGQQTTTEDSEPPLDDIVEKRTVAEKRILSYDPVREADIMFEKRIWRVIDIREKMNQPFAYPKRRFFTILQEAAENEELRVFAPSTDGDFEQRLTPQEVASMGASIDTVTTFDPITYEEKQQIVRNELNPEDVRRFRIKEIWFFDEETSTLQVRILGIAPLLDVIDPNTGEYRGEKVMFWVYYPEARKVLAREQCFTFGNDASPLTWEDIFEMRFFSSYIYKESNVHDRRLQDYVQGVDLLMEADRIRMEIFNREHDLWEY